MNIYTQTHTLDVGENMMQIFRYWNGQIGLQDMNDKKYIYFSYFSPWMIIFMLVYTDIVNDTQIKKII